MIQEQAQATMNMFISLNFIELPVAGSFILAGFLFFCLHWKVLNMRV